MIPGIGASVAAIKVIPQWIELVSVEVVSMNYYTDDYNHENPLPGPRNFIKCTIGTSFSWPQSSYIVSVAIYKKVVDAFENVYWNHLNKWVTVTMNGYVGYGYYPRSIDSQLENGDYRFQLDAAQVAIVNGFFPGRANYENNPKQLYVSNYKFDPNS